MNDSVVVPKVAPGDKADLAEQLSVYLDNWLWIAAVAVAFILVAGFFAFIATPVYRTNALVQVEEKGNSLGALGELSSVLSGEMPTGAEIEIVKSRAVLGTAVRELGLEVDARPKHFPLIGEAIARRHEGPNLASSLFGLSGYAWGGESIRVERLELPRSLVGRELILTAEPGNAFNLHYEDRHLLQGQVGKPADADGVSIFVSELKAQPSTRFVVRRLSWLGALEKLRFNLQVRELGRQTGILEFSLDGTHPDVIARTLNAIAQTYLRQNVERTSEDAARTLVFLEEQLPQLKAQLDSAEASLNRFRVRQGTIDLSLETQGLLEQVGEIEKQISELELKHAELAQRFTAEHPVMQAIQDQRRELLTLRASMETQIRELPAAEQDSLRLMRDVRVANELYMLLLNRAQELKVVRAGTVGNVRIIDAAIEPVTPVKPNKTRILFIASIVGLAAGVLLVSVREAMNPMIRDTDDLEKASGLPVYAVVPHSEQEQELNAKSGAKPSSGGLLFSKCGDDVAIESLRSLRTSLEFLLLESQSNIITVGGPAPNAGKSFISANLAALFAQSGRSVVLIDADLRRGHLHRQLGLPRAPGLAEAVRDSIELSGAISKSVSGGFSFLSTGELPPNPAELIASNRFDRLLSQLRHDFDIVLMDAPPVLGAAESMTLARLSSINLLVVRSERQTPREVALTVSQLKQAGANINGFVLNDLSAHSRRHVYAGYNYYRYSKNS